MVGIELLQLERARIELLRLQECQLAPLDHAAPSENGHEADVRDLPRPIVPTATDVVGINSDRPVRTESYSSLHAREMRDEHQIERLFMRIGKGRQLEGDPPVALGEQTYEELYDLN